jgi:hypothetical protein
MVISLRQRELYIAVFFETTVELHFMQFDIFKNVKRGCDLTVVAYFVSILLFSE